MSLAFALKTRVHRLLRHAVARALTTAPSLPSVSPAAEDILTPHSRGARPARNTVAQLSRARPLGAVRGNPLEQFGFPWGSR